jgi:hypothetical protein
METEYYEDLSMFCEYHLDDILGMVEFVVPSEHNVRLAIDGVDDILELSVTELRAWLDENNWSLEETSAGYVCRDICIAWYSPAGVLGAVSPFHPSYLTD